MDPWVRRTLSWFHSSLPVLKFFWTWMLTFFFFIKGVNVTAMNVTIIKIIYVTLALLFIISFQLSREMWQKMIIYFWIIILTYATFVCLVELLFQFQVFRELCQNLGINQTWQENIGLNSFEIEELIVFLVIEFVGIVFVLILFILLRKVKPVAVIRIKYVERLVEVLDTFFDITKLTIFGIMMSCIARVSFINLLILMAAVTSMVLRRVYRYIIIQFISLFSAVILLSQMILQLNYFMSNNDVTCQSGNNSVVMNIDTWIGVGKMKSNEPILFSVIGYVCNIALVTIYTVVVKEESVLQGLNQKSGWNPHKMFNDIIYLDSHKDFYSYIKFLLKYGFYRYGIEFTYILIALLIQARLDFWALVYSLWLLIFILFPNGIFFIWRFFNGFLFITIPLQYAASVGVYPTRCFGFDLEIIPVYNNTFQWMFLPVGSWKPDGFSLFWDSLVFLFTLCQSNVFEFEKKYNRHELAKISPTSVISIDPDAVIHRNTTFGLIRYIVFCSLRNFAAISFFMAATKSITIFSLLYGIGFVWILWNVDDYYIRSSDRTKEIWKYLLITNVLIIFLRACLQIPGCIFMNNLVGNSCWIVQLFGISCYKTSNNTILFLRVPIFSTVENTENVCWVSPTMLGIEWDILCFITLIFHRRFLQSEYYTIMAKEEEQNRKFSFKAAKILEELNAKDIKESQEKYIKNFKKIQKNMQRLEESQKRIRGITVHEPYTHQEAVTSGDYYMFQDNDKVVRRCTDVDESLQSEVKSEQEESLDDDEPTEHRTPNITQLIETVLKADDLEEVLKLADQSSIKSSNETCCIAKSHTSSDDTVEEEYQHFCICDDVDETTEKQSSIDSRKEIEKKKIIFKDNKLQPTVDFHRRKTSESSKSKEERIDQDHLSGTCNCKNCPCRLQFYHRFYVFVKFFLTFINCLVISLSQLCNSMARDYKYVTKQLEKERLTDKLDASKGFPASSVVVRSLAAKEKTSNYIRLLVAIYELIMSRFNTVCFFAVFLLQIKNSTIYSLPLPLMVLYWGSLSVPRPTKRFWKMMLLYTSLLLIFECIIRSQVMPSDDWDWISWSIDYETKEIFTVEKMENYSVYFLGIIMTMVWQRSNLKSMGLWSSLEPMEWRGNFFRRAYQSMKHFFEKLLYNTANRIPVDVYTHMFFCDFINIFVFIFGFASITGVESLQEKKEDGVTRYFYENKIPPALLLIFIVQCLAIFLDRWIYLRRHVVAKLIFQLIQITLVHLSLFIILPTLLLRRFNHMFFPGLWYGIKCVYFLLSAYQIRCGYPASVHGHALCQSYNMINNYLYQIYLWCPFVYELRTITDWLWTETTLTLSEWLGMEDIFCTVFILKCWRNYDNRYSYKRGHKITRTIKFLVGGGIVLLFFLFLIFPLVFFTFGHVAGKKNVPHDMQLIFRIGSMQPIFNAYTTDIRSFTIEEWVRLQELYRYSPPATTFLSEYSNEDVGMARFLNYSNSEWTLSPTAEMSLVDTLKKGKTIKITLEWKINRDTEDKERSTLTVGYRSVELNARERTELLNIFENNATSFTVENIMPRFLKVSSSSMTGTVEVLELPYDGEEITYMNVTFSMEFKEHSHWWQAYLQHQLKFVNAIFLNSANNEIIMYTFNDKIFSPGIWSYVSAQGIIGLYTTFLISASLLVRKICRGRTSQVFLDYIPNVDCILQLLLDIYFVREHKDGKLEEELFAKLIFLFRSPETIIQWTRMPVRD